MIQWVLSNKEWLFSGAGLSVLIFLIWIFNTFIRKKKHIIIEDSNLPYQKKLCEDIGKVSIGKRIERVIELMNQNRLHEVFAKADIAKILGLPSVGSLEKIIASENDVDFCFIEKFSNTFGINEDWLSTGRGSPFDVSKYELNPIDFFSLIQTEKPQRIYFVRDDSEENRVLIVLKIHEWSGQGFLFRVLGGPWHISSHVGATGQRQILGFYRLILKLKEESYSKCWGQDVDVMTFDQLYGGEIFPGEVVDRHFTKRYWWDDFLDVNGNHVISEDYRNWYGQWFSDAQAIVKWKLREQNDNFKASLINICTKIPKIQKILMFGSRVVGDATPVSDIDMAIISQKINAVEWDEFVNTLENTTMLKLDIHLWSEMNEDFKNKVITSGEIVYERKKGERKY